MRTLERMASALSVSEHFSMEAFTPAQILAIRAMADEVCRERLAAEAPRRGRPPKAVATVAPAPRYEWLPDGSLVATREDAMRAIRCSRRSIYNLIERGELVPTAGPGTRASAEIAARYRTQKPSDWFGV